MQVVQEKMMRSCQVFGDMESHCGVYLHQAAFHIVQFALNKKRLEPDSLIIHQVFRWSNGAKISQVYISLSSSFCLQIRLTIAVK